MESESRERMEESDKTSKHRAPPVSEEEQCRMFVEESVRLRGDIT